MAQPLRCDVHEENAGVLLIQNLAEHKVLVACPECVPDMVLTLAQSTGVAAIIAELAQDELYAQVEQQKKTAAAARRGKGRKSDAEPQDIPLGDVSTAPEQ